MLTVELLSFAPASQRSIAILSALDAAAPAPIVATTTTRYAGQSDVLVLWGPGAPDRFAPMAAQLARGGHVLALDLAYWHRDRKFRVSIDAAHPQQWVMRKDWPGKRFASDGAPIRDAWQKTGPVIVAGIGRKARVQYGDDVVERWERQMLAQAAARWPQRRVLYRRKQTDAPIPAGAVLASGRPIDELLAGASLLVTWHSNVAVDAIRLGVPVICRDGAAAAVCPSAFSDVDPQPLAPDVRERFLRNLSYFQWSADEAAQFWAWATEMLA